MVCVTEHKVNRQTYKHRAVNDLMYMYIQKDPTNKEHFGISYNTLFLYEAAPSIEVINESVLWKNLEHRQKSKKGNIMSFP